MAGELDPFWPTNLSDVSIALETLSEWDPDLATLLQEGSDPLLVLEAPLIELKNGRTQR